MRVRTIFAAGVEIGFLPSEVAMSVASGGGGRWWVVVVYLFGGGHESQGRGDVVNKEALAIDANRRR